eukprot:TRINITY_DN28384_c0_g1_i1.p1 TRINITY_DN28384_c0_g1~~TRINITY_DN28384_c0_g1_i1.p1  ORF type:complete len:1694 (+),score=549.11 TRINITY_DN28384_c0_g1_i1:89-5170(+)
MGSLEQMLNTRVDMSVLEGKSFMIFEATNVWRQVAFFCVSHPYFTVVIYLLIICNALSMIIVTPLDDENSDKAKVVQTLDRVVLGMFVAEMLLRMVALGAFRGKNCYWKNSWNRLDFIVVVGSLLGEVFERRGFSAFRAFRAMRIMRAVKFFNGIRDIMDSLRKGISLVIDNAVFMLFFFLVFGVMAVEFYQNSMSRVCVVEADYASGLVSYPLTFSSCSLDAAIKAAYKDGTDTTIYPGSCPDGMVCIPVSNDEYNYGFTHFDDVLHAMLVNMQISTLSSWTGIAYHMQGADNWGGVVLYSICLVFLLNFVCVNLFVAVIGLVYSSARNEAQEEMVKHPALYELRYDADTARMVSRQRRIDATVRWGIVSERISMSCEAWGHRDGAEPHHRRQEPRLSRWSSLRKELYPIVDSRAAHVFIALLITVNVCIQATDRADASERHKNTLEMCEYLFTGFFLLEWFVRFAVIGNSSPIRFFSNPWHKLDTVVMLLSVLTLILYQRSVSFFRFFRVLQLFFYFEGLKPLAELLKKSSAGLPAAFDLIIFATFSFFVFSLAGVQFFAGKMKDPDTGERTRLHFDHFFSGVLLLFKVMTGDSWEFNMWVAWDGSGWTGCVFILVFYMWSVWVLVNLFTAIVLDSFGEPDSEKYAKQMEEYIEVRRKALSRMARKRQEQAEKNWGLRHKMKKFFALPQVVAEERKRAEDEILGEDLQEIDPAQLRMLMRDYRAFRKAGGGQDNGEMIDVGTGALSDVEWNTTVAITKNRREKHALLLETGYAARVLTVDGVADFSGGEEQIKVNYPMAGYIFEDDLLLELSALQGAELDMAALKGNACFCLGPKNRLRVVILKVVESRLYELFMMVVVVFSTFVLVFEPASEATNWRAENERESQTYKYLRQLDYLFFIVFAQEALLKSVAMGYWPTTARKAYLDDPWNVLDFVLLVALAVALFVPDFALSVIVGKMQSLRTLRPIRILRKIESLRVMVAAVWGALPQTALIAIGTSVMLGLCGMFAVGQFGGKLHYCTDSTRAGKADCVGEFTNDNGVRVPRAWLVPHQNFDDISSATLTLIEIVSLASWTAPMFTTMDITDVDKQPEFMNSPLNCFFFVVLVIGVSLFMVNIFVAVILDKINEEMGTGILTSEQKAWADFRRTARLYESKVSEAKPPDETSEGFRLLLYQLIHSKYFEPAIIVLIAINIAFMSSSHASEPQWWTDTLFMIDLIFLFGIYSVEMLIKVIAYGGVSGYLKSPWNTFDGFVVLGGIAAIVIVRVAKYEPAAALGAIRMLRVARIFKLMTASRGIKFLFRTLIVSLPEIFNITFLAFLLIYVYTIFGKEVFGRIRFQSEVNNNANFRTSPDGLWTIFRILTLDNWHLLMHDTEVRPPLCTSASNGRLTHNGADWDGPWADHNDCGNPVLARLFFLSFFLVGVYVFLNLVIAVILDKFGHIYSEDNFSLNEDHLKEYDDSWSAQDLRGKGEIRRWQVRNIVHDLYGKGNPLGCDLLGVEGTLGRKRFNYVLWAINEMHSQRASGAGKKRRKVDDVIVVIRFRELLNILTLNHVRFFHPESLPYDQKKSWEVQHSNIEQRLAALKIVAWCVSHQTMKQVEKKLGSKVYVIKKIREYMFWRKAAEVARAQGRRPPPPPTERVAMLRVQQLDQARAEEEARRKALTEEASKPRDRPELIGISKPKVGTAPDDDADE